MGGTPEERFFNAFKSLTGRSINMANILMNFPMKREYNNAAAALLLELKREVERMREALGEKEEMK